MPAPPERKNARSAVATAISSAISHAPAVAPEVARAGAPSRARSSCARRAPAIVVALVFLSSMRVAPPGNRPSRSFRWPGAVGGVDARAGPLQPPAVAEPPVLVVDAKVPRHRHRQHVGREAARVVSHPAHEAQTRRRVPLGRLVPRDDHALRGDRGRPGASAARRRPGARRSPPARRARRGCRPAATRDAGPGRARGTIPFGKLRTIVKPFVAAPAARSAASAPARPRASSAV